MKIRTLLSTWALPALMLGACQSGPRVVENPLIETSNTMTLDITRVELTDTATILQVDAYFTPHYWIRISSDTYLNAGGKKYALTKATGITPDSLFWMPESGEASFQLTFQPLPLRTRSFDFIESDCDDCFKLFGIDLTGKKTYDAPEDIPAEAMQVDGNAAMPAPIFKSGETTVEVHLLHYRPELGKEIALYLNTLSGNQEEHTANIDPETGIATFRFKQYGPAQALISTPAHWGCTARIAPGEQLSIYIDMRHSGQRIVSRRTEGAAPLSRFCYATGTYANLNNLYFALSGSHAPLRTMNLYNGEFADYKMSAKDYVAHVADKYKALSDSIAADTVPPLMKESMLLSLKEEAVTAMLQGDFFREHNYRALNNDWENPVKGIDRMTPEEKAEVCKLFDINDPMLLMSAYASDYLRAVMYADDAWLKATGIQTGLIPSLRKYARLAPKVQNGTLTDDDLNIFGTNDDPFYADALRQMQAETVAKLEAVKDKAIIEQTPDVPVEKLFDTLIAPYKGKVVFVDFWNTWCGPCRASIKATEPLKATELKSENLVWLYIANETSPLVQYKTMIPGIQGKHFRLNEQQWRYLCDKFQIDGIPSYVLVKKDGTYELRNDLRDHDLLQKTLKEEIAR